MPGCDRLLEYHPGVELDLYVDDFTVPFKGARQQILKGLPSAARFLLDVSRRILGCGIALEKAELVAPSYDLLQRLLQGLGELAACRGGNVLPEPRVGVEFCPTPGALGGVAGP